MITALTLLSFFGCRINAQEKELVSVYYHRSGMRIDDRVTISVKKTADIYTVKFEEGRYEEDANTNFEITQSDFDALADILFEMDKPRKERREHIRDLMQKLDVEFIQNGKPVSRQYSINQNMSRKTSELQKQAVDLMHRWIDKYKQRSEIRISYSKGIATPTQVYTHAEPADLVKDLGEFTERHNPNHVEQPGGSKNHSHRWRALKPGKVTVWLKELNTGYEGDLSSGFEPYGCYIIDEKLNVKFSKEETEKAKSKFNER